MKITARQLLAIANSGILDKLKGQDIPTLGAYRIARFRAVIAPEAARVQQAWNGLFTEERSIPVTGTPGSRSIKPECMEAFLAEVGPLLAEELELTVKPLTLDDLAGAKISAADIEALGPLLAAE